MRLALPKSDGFVTHPATGMRVMLRRNDEWPADDPLVQARPDLFRILDVVEQASAEPGVRRQVRRG